MKKIDTYITEKFRINKNTNVMTSKSEIVEYLHDLIKKIFRDEYNINDKEFRIYDSTDDNKVVNNIEEVECLTIYFNKNYREDKKLHEKIVKYLSSKLNNFSDNIEIKEHTLQSGAYKIRIHLKKEIFK